LFRTVNKTTYHKVQGLFLCKNKKNNNNKTKQKTNKKQTKNKKTNKQKTKEKNPAHFNGLFKSLYLNYVNSNELMPTSSFTTGFPGIIR